MLLWFIFFHWVVTQTIIIIISPMVTSELNVKTQAACTIEREREMNEKKIMRYSWGREA